MNIRISMLAALAACLLTALQGCGGSAASPAASPMAASSGSYNVNVESSFPRNGQAGVAQNATISLTFNEEMISSTVNNGTFRLRENGNTPVIGEITVAGKSVTFRPLQPLKPFTVYTATATTGMLCQDEQVSLQNDYSWTFVTGATLDTTPPEVADTAFGIQVLQSGVHQPVFVAFFSEVMDPATVNTGSVHLAGPDGAAVPLQIQYIGVSALIYPTVALLPDSDYTATVTTGAADLAGNHMDKPRVWTVTTPSLASLTGKSAPTVVSTTPGHDAAGVLLGTEITATFSQVMDPATVTQATFRVYAPGHVRVAGALTLSGVNATFVPAQLLAPDTTYVVDIDPAAQSLDGIPLAAQFEWTFTTGEDVAGTPPVVQFTTPAPGETGVTLNKSILAAFDEPMDPTTLSTATFTVTREDGEAVTGTVSYVNLAAVFIPDTALVAGVTYTARITTGVTDAGGEALAADYVWSFSTGTQIADTIPAVLFTNPGANETQVTFESPQVQIAFSEVMDPLTVNADNIVMTAPDGTVVPGTFDYLAYVVIFTPSVPLEQFTTYTVTVKTGVRDLEGTALAHDYSWWFVTTGAM